MLIRQRTPLKRNSLALFQNCRRVRQALSERTSAFHFWPSTIARLVFSVILSSAILLIIIRILLASVFRNLVGFGCSVNADATVVSISWLADSRYLQHKRRKQCNTQNRNSSTQKIKRTIYLLTLWVVILRRKNFKIFVNKNWSERDNITPITGTLRRRETLKKKVLFYRWRETMTIIIINYNGQIPMES